MSTRYVWEKETFTSTKLGSWKSDTIGLSLSSTGKTKITLCASYSVGLDSYNIPRISPTGKTRVIWENGAIVTGELIQQFYPISTYQYAIVEPQGSDGNPLSSYIAKPTSTTGNLFWRINKRNASNSTLIFFLSTSSDSYYDNSGNVPAQTAQQVTTSSTTFLSSNSSSTYPHSGVVNSQKAILTYKGSDNIDPTALSYATSVDYIGSDTKLPYTITPTFSQKYSGSIEYNMEYRADGGSWNSSTRWSTSTSGNRTNFSANTYQFRVRARDTYGFTSTTYATGPVCTVIYPATTHNVYLSVSPSGAGTVSGAGEYEENSTVTVYATPYSGYTFSYWQSGGSAVSYNSTYSFTLGTSDKTLTAVFSKITYTVNLSVSPSSSGSVSGAGIYDTGSYVTIKATPYSGYSFVRWEENGSYVSSNSSYSFTISSSRSFIAVFQKVTYSVSLSASPSNAGTLSGAGNYTSGSQVTVVATPYSGYEFSEWKEGTNTVSTSASYSFSISSNRTLTAIFKQSLKMWIGINGKARKTIAIYVGVNGAARKVKAAWVGVNGIARKFF